MAQMNPKIFLYNTAISVQPPYIAGHSLQQDKIRRANGLYNRKIDR